MTITLQPHLQAGRRSEPDCSADPLSGLTPPERSHTALHCPEGPVSYGELDDLVDRRARELSDAQASTVTLHAVAASRDLESVVELLAAWRARRVVLMLPPGDSARLLTAAWPDRGPEGEGYELHPDLALLMSTSGSTGSPKLVRLSHANLASNAAAIADYLRLTHDDVALTTLPLHYCYGLSVLTSHLHARATVVLTEESVTSSALWELASRHGVTSFAGVPHTFDLLERAGQVDHLPRSLRCLTQAGGRMAPDDVRRWAQRGSSSGVDFVVMYGQTEATARIAWLPPELVQRRPDAVGVAIPGGELRVEPVRGLDGHFPPGTGELVYRGPNVMLGYATEAADLARGPDLEQLRTGDLGRCDEDGVFRVVGRLARFAKVYGLRIDLDAAEQALTRVGVVARVLEHREQLAVFVQGGARSRRVAETVRVETGLPAHAVRVHPVEELPFNRQGKRDDACLRELLTTDSATPATGDDPSPAERVRSTYASVLGRPEATLDDSFVALRGDSLSFVEANVRLVELFDEVPPDWPQLSARQLAASVAGRVEPSPRRAPSDRLRRWRTWPRVDASLVLRAVAIVLVVGSHTDVWMVPGGAHTLLALLGFSLVRFHLHSPPTEDPSPSRSARVGSMLVKIIVPAFLVTSTVAVLRGTYDVTTIAGLNNLLGADQWTDQWRLWFIEAIAWGLLLVTVVLRVPLFDRWERRGPYLTPLTLLVLTLVLRWAWIGWEADNPQRYSLPFVWSFLLLGWLAARSTTTPLRIVTTALAALATVGFFGDPVREGVVLGALVVMVWVPQVRLPRRLVPALGVVAASSLWVYLVHWEVYPPVEEVSEPLALAVSFASGIAAWWGWTALTRRSRTLRWAG